MKHASRINLQRPLHIAVLALVPGLAFAQSDTVNTVKSSDENDTVNLVNMQAYLQMAQPNLVQGNAIAHPGPSDKTDPGTGLPVPTAPPAYGSAQYMQEMAAFQQYQNSMTQVIDLQNDVRRLAGQYTHMIDEAGRAAREKDPAEQRHLFENFLYDSRVFLRDHYDPSYQLWVLRAVAALKLDKPATGIQAAQILSLMPPNQRAEPRIQKMLSVLGSHGWLPKDKPAEAQPNPASPAPDKPGK
ncbi:MAG: hypothetical protein ABSA05_11595 [Opitutaceae bacterium]